MSSEVPHCAIGDICCGIYDGPHATPPPSDTGPIFFRIENIEKSGRINLSDIRRINDADFPKWTRRVQPQEDDIVFSYEANLGLFCKIPAGFHGCLGRRLALMRPRRDKVDPRYLLYACLSPQFQELLRQRTVLGSTVDRISLREFPSYQIPLPPLPKQRAIASVLQALDDKIELNRRMNETLEAMSRSLFQSWFVDFDPVRAKLDGRQPAGLTASVADLFPASFEESPLGPIPQGWKVGTIEEATSLIIDYRGRTPKKLGADWSLCGVPAVSAKNIKGGRLVRRDMLNYVSDDLFERWMKDKLAICDILMTSEAPLGELYYLALDARFCLSQRVFALRANPSCCEPTFLYYWLESPSCQAEIANRGTGTTVEGIRQSELRKVRVLLPPPAIQKAAAQYLADWTEQVHRNEEQSSTLADMRDMLLPKLLSGELSVPVAKSKLGATA